MIVSREFRESDIKFIDEIFKRQPELGVPSLKNIIINTTLESNGKVIGYGAVKQFAEAVLILDKLISKKEKAIALVEAMKTAIVFSRQANLEILYAISNSDSFTEVLQNRYKFVKVPGVLLCRSLSFDEE